MGYSGVKFIVSSWSQTIDRDGILVVQPAAASKGSACQLVLEWVPGTNPPEFTASCENVDCAGSCELQTVTLPDGTTVFTCECVGGMATLRAAKATGKKAKKKAKKSK